ncbi:hypothetical protein TNCV_4169061 [Trichonephila clavipes]|nr:hypothetical protein TNCV_4169061 [Trichonephila clavipes]
MNTPPSTDHLPPILNSNPPRNDHETERKKTTLSLSLAKTAIPGQRTRTSINSRFNYQNKVEVEIYKGKSEFFTVTQNPKDKRLCLGRTRYSGHPPNDTLNPLRTYQQVLDFTQDKLAIRTLNCQRAHQTDFDDVIS